MFLLPSINIKLKPKILDMRPGTRVVSNSFDMGDWTSEETAEAVEGCRTYCRAHFWVVPAKVEGTWKLPDGGELRLQQTYQMIEGSLRVGTSNMRISNGKVIGDQIVFTAGDARYTGRVNGNAIEGIAKLPSAGKRHDSDWRAPVACGTGRPYPFVCPSTDQRPAPAPARISSPPMIDRFFQACTICATALAARLAGSRSRGTGTARHR